MKKLKFQILIVLGALALLPVTGFSQGVPPSSTYNAQTLTIPVTKLTAAAGTTNLVNGWSSVVSVTNTSTTWNISSNAFISVTNVISVTNTVYADMSVISQKDLGVVFNESTGVGTNIYSFARGISSSKIDTNNLATVTIGHSAAGTITGSTNFPSTWMGGFGVVRLTQIQWTAAADGWTNNGISFGKIVSVK